MAEHDRKTHDFKWIAIDSDGGYAAWRTAKLKAAETALGQAPVEVNRLTAPTESERAELLRRCETNNFAVYNSAEASENIAADLRRFADAFGLRIAERHRSAGEQGIVALQPTEEEGKRGYIPYSTKPLKWHTDGYYNAANDRISAFVLHCVRQAGRGGVNQLLDPEILYIRLRDEHPGYLRALMHPQAMTIPENREPDGSLRPASVGPVFYPDPETGRMQMRYTARTRSIVWRDDPATREAEHWLREYLDRPDPLTCQIRLEAGQGVLNNNVLHNRTGFEKGADMDTSRLIYRVRFHNRIGRK